MKKFALAAMILTASLPIPALARSDNDRIMDMIAGKSSLPVAEVEKRIAAAKSFPLGSKENPVRAHMPQGQIAYLSRLACADGGIPGFRRLGNEGMGPFGGIVDAYEVDCGMASPGKQIIRMDMYHPGYIETVPVNGFKFAY